MNKYIISLALFLLFSTVYAADWSSSSISYLYGKGYKVPGSTQSEVDHSIFTFDHASGWSYGDHYFFTDVSKTGTVSSDLYFEWAPRWSSSKTFDIDYGRAIKDILLAAQLNVAPNAPRTELFGLALDFHLPRFTVCQINLYWRNDRQRDGSTYQITLVWAHPIVVKGQSFSFEGFIDFAGKEGEGSLASESNILAQPQLLWKANDKMALGLEYQYWKNKFGIKDLNESLPQFIFKWTL